ncbi:hypothetical protein V9T40_006335 [Parthenolecanium corni]|uniref:CCHC-type domain-containing protein n=1 Tax=Parthenolecanium corni TaxID=536013 RepID=A0AAN9Y6J2_9HEMI
MPRRDQRRRSRILKRTQKAIEQSDAEQSSNDSNGSFHGFSDFDNTLVSEKLNPSSFVEEINITLSSSVVDTNINLSSSVEEINTNPSPSSSVEEINTNPLPSSSVEDININVSSSSCAEMAEKIIERKHPEWIFNGKQFREWKIRIENLLACDDLEDLLCDEKEEKKYVNLRPSDRKEKMPDYHKNQQKAKKIIFEYIDNTYLNRISECATVKEMILLLEHEHKVTSRVGRIGARRKWVNMKYNIGGDLRKFLLIYEACMREYEEAGGEISEEDKIDQLQSAMPESYECAADWFENLPNAKQKYENYRTKLIEKFDRYQQKKTDFKKPDRREKSPETDEKSQSSGDDYRWKKCYNCGGYGHQSKDCPSRKRPESDSKERICSNENQTVSDHEKRKSKTFERINWAKSAQLNQPTLHAITIEEYNEKTAAIKQKADVEKFLKDNEFSITQYGVFFDKLANIMNHVRKTKAGSEMVTHVADETDKVLKDGKVFDIVPSILAAVRKVVTSEIGRKNIFAVAHFIQDELRVPNLFPMCLSLKKTALAILLSKDGLKSLVKLKRNHRDLYMSPQTAPLMEALDKSFPILSLPTGSSDSENHQPSGRLSGMKAAALSTLHAISIEEYDEKTTAIKQKPEVKTFLEDNDFVISQYGVFFDKLANIMNHVRKTKAGSEMVTHVANETDKVLKEGKVFDFVQSILAAVRKVLTSQIGRKNVFAVAYFIKDELRVPDLFAMFLSWKRMIIDNLIFSKDGLKALVMLYQNSYKLDHSPKTAQLMKVLDRDFPILSLPDGSSDTNNNQTKGQANVQSLFRQLSGGEKKRGSRRFS